MNWWEWPNVRATYARAFHEWKTTHDETQEQIAERGGLSGQNMISKTLYNDNLGPSVETFLRALKGIELTPAEFFARLDEGPLAGPRPTSPTQTTAPPDAPRAAPLVRRALALVRAIRALDESQGRSRRRSRTR